MWLYLRSWGQCMHVNSYEARERIVLYQKHFYDVYIFWIILLAFSVIMKSGWDYFLLIHSSSLYSKFYCSRYTFYFTIWHIHTLTMYSRQKPLYETWKWKFLVEIICYYNVCRKKKVKRLLVNTHWINKKNL